MAELMPDLTKDSRNTIQLITLDLASSSAFIISTLALTVPLKYTGFRSQSLGDLADLLHLPSRPSAEYPRYRGLRLHQSANTVSTGRTRRTLLSIILLHLLGVIASSVAHLKYLGV